ncbi:hypothetical protein [Flammeovirga aprica]|uniref:Uncharacterized protein n=1 Tax=Flammeovirga aprica JL-4 TaxID=694437 RepID=A0A7X9RUV9_9BACT|nr:hypothetical protein [Flammeovirga aprica]NME69069.1 hypothetical protein [Flammeovirga aprica JL-4]
MKVLIDIEDSKVEFVLELLNNLKFVKTEPLTPHKAEVLQSLSEAVTEMRLIKKGKLKATPAKDLLDEL